MKNAKILSDVNKERTINDKFKIFTKFYCLYNGVKTLALRRNL